MEQLKLKIRTAGFRAGPEPERPQDTGTIWLYTENKKGAKFHIATIQITRPFMKINIYVPSHTKILIEQIRDMARALKGSTH